MLGKKSSFLLSTISLALASTAIYASDVQSFDPIVYVPNIRPGFEFGLTVLALKPGASNLNYIIYNKELPVQTPTWTEKEVRPGFNPAFTLSAGYAIHGGRDVNLDWTHMSSSTTDTVSTPSASYFLGPDYEIGPDGLPIRTASNKTRFEYDVVNLDVDQRINVGKPVEIRFFGGLSTAFLREQVNTTFAGNTLTSPYAGPFNTMQDITANFSGIGPRFGIESDVNLHNGIGFLGEAAASALIGSSYAKTNFTSSAVQLKDLYGQNFNYQFIRDQNVTQVIPGFDAKLGITYNHTFNRGTILSIKAGYTAAVYINAISQYLPGSLVADAPLESGGIFVATMNHTLSNYSVQGPFLEGSVKI